MPLELDAVQALIIREVGDVNPDTGDPTTAPTGVIAANMDDLWEKHAAWDQVRGGIRALYVRRDAIRLVLSVLATRVYDAADNIDGLSMRANHIWQHYQQMYDDTVAEIKSTMAGVSRSASSGSDNIGRIPATIRRPSRRNPTNAELYQYGALRDP